MFDIVKRIYVTLLSGFIGAPQATLSLDSILPTFKRFWLNNPETRVNNHINKALMSSWQLSMDEILKGYYVIHPELPDEEGLSLKVFIDDLKSVSSDEFLKQLNEENDYEEIFSYVGSNIDNIVILLNKRFKLSEKLNSFSDIYYLTDHFIQYFIREVPIAFNFHFRKELKEGKEAKHAIDLLYFQTIRELVSQISREQTVQIEHLKRIDRSVKQSFQEDTFTKTAILSAINKLYNNIYHDIETVKNKVNIIEGQNYEIKKELEDQGRRIIKLVNRNDTNNKITLKIDTDVLEFVKTKNFFKNLDFTNDELVSDYEKVEEEIKKAIDDFFFSHLFSVTQNKEKRAFTLNGNDFFVSSEISKNKYLAYTVVPSEFSSEVPNYISNNILSIGLIQGISISFPKDDFVFQAVFNKILSKLSQLTYHIYSGLEHFIKTKVRKLESLCIRGLRQLISDEIRRSHLNIDIEKFNFTITYIQNNGTTSCCYQLDYASLDNLINCLKNLPHRYYSAFVLILGYASMHAPDEFIFRYKEKMIEGVFYDNANLSNMFYIGDKNYHIIYEIEKLFYSSDDLFNIEVCRYNDFVLEVTMDHSISELFRAAVYSLKDDLEDQFKTNINRNQEALDVLFFKNFKVHGETILEKTKKYFTSLDNSIPHQD